MSQKEQNKDVSRSSVPRQNSDIRKCPYMQIQHFRTSSEYNWDSIDHTLNFKWPFFLGCQHSVGERVLLRGTVL